MVADDLFGMTPCVEVCGIDEIAAELDKAVDDPLRLLDAGAPAEVPYARGAQDAGARACAAVESVRCAAGAVELSAAIGARDAASEAELRHRNAVRTCAPTDHRQSRRRAVDDLFICERPPHVVIPARKYQLFIHVINLSVLEHIVVAAVHLHEYGLADVCGGIRQRPVQSEIAEK
jgi:hypothetical protein